LVAALVELYPDCAIYERSDVDVRKKEGLEPVKGWLHNPQESTQVTIEEHGVKIHVDVEQGHKTGFYLDQRDSRLAAGRYATGKPF
jgi:23S rRNA (cytosine1962-C5)-methyltransferase